MKGILFKVILTFIVSNFYFSTLLAQNSRSSLFAEVNMLKEQADNQDAEMLTPSSYEKGMEYLEKAQSDFEKGKSLEKIQKNIDKATGEFEYCVEHAPEARTMFNDALDARSAAVEAGSPDNQEEMWNDAEKRLNHAAEKLEKGKESKAASVSEEAKEQYQSTEMESIKTNVFGEAEEMIDEAEDNKVQKTAEKTLDGAETSLTKGVTVAEASRYNLTEAEMYAKEAEYKAKQSMAINKEVKELKKSKASKEDIILGHQSDIARIGSVVGISPAFDEGTANGVDEVNSAVQALRDSMDMLMGTIDELQGNLDEYSSEIGSLEEVRAMLAHEREVEAKFNEVFNMFNPDEVEVFRQQDKIILRMKSFAFPIGSAEIQQSNYATLRQVENAVRVFPTNEITVEGHTDSSGGEKANQKLSEERAEAVKNYMSANLPEYDADHIKAVGYGESKPIASNDTKEGAQMNRRIDVVIDVRRD
ncbi:OmpA family protein [Sediminitomix flava]|uniref:Outer membrane protein OmpA-like peptidoglycan-associated protein n=1 Tax=Sediminitomix flava TaxID=379075 RepID=A0A315ZAE8_SEDFL|nr:OmpA family protein [Sediminitomix flava]PWJ42129.1 outer membrane protein OmpA-like peptidoglycan-associated protein [Sediminitomix flava]